MRTKNIYDNYTIISCALIFLLSIYLRSSINIGGDTGFYLDLGKRIAQGQKFYYDFFESNLPLSFYFYALQYHLANFLKISPILLSEIFVNSLGLLSLLWASHILKKAEFENRHHRNLIIIGFFLGFFLRLQALPNGEYGTKTSFFLIVAIPYCAYSFLINKDLTKLHLTVRGVLMGLIPCFKPHYIIFPIAIEIYKAMQEKSWKFYAKLDILIATLILALYLNFLVKITPEYIEFMIPMWREYYTVYGDFSIFIKNLFYNLNRTILPFALILPMFVYIKLSYENKILLVFFICASSLLLAENISSLDQLATFYAILMPVLLNFAYDFYRSPYLDFSKRKLIIFILFFLPFFDLNSSFKAFYGLVYLWWLWAALPFLYYHKKIKNYTKLIPYFIFYFAIFITEIYFEITQQANYMRCFGAASLIITLYFFEKWHKKIYAKFSIFLVIITSLYCSYIFHEFVYATKSAINHDGYFMTPSKTSDAMTNIVKIYAKNSDESFLAFSQWIGNQFPLTNYLKKENYHKYAVGYAYDLNAKNAIFSTNNADRAFVYNYLLDDLKKQLKNQKIKVIFVNNDANFSPAGNGCRISYLEYYMRDLAFAKLFKENFHYQTRIIEYKRNINKLAPSKEKLYHDFEVYVRN